ncbi:hypothetical protein vseg_004313 [Gypsophila vaccaria]
MTCLVPHLKCKLSSILHPLLPSTTSSSSSPLLRSREMSCFRTHCAVSISPPPSTASEAVKFDIEKLRLAYAQSNSSALPPYAPLTYVNPLDNAHEGKFDSTSATETVIEDEEAVIAAAAAEALALARAAANLAKNAALMANTSQPESKSVLPEDQSLQLKRSQLLNEEQLQNTGNNIESSYNVLKEGDSIQSANSDLE